MNHQFARLPVKEDESIFNLASNLRYTKTMLI